MEIREEVCFMGNYFGDVRWIKVVSVNHKACSVLGPDNQEGNLLKI